MNAGLRGHQFMKEGAEKVLEHPMLPFGVVDLLLSGIQNCGDLVLLFTARHSSWKCVDRASIELGIDRVSLEFNEELRLPKVIEVIEQVASVDLLGGPNPKNERGVDPFSVEVEIGRLPDVVFAPTSPVEENIPLLKNRRSVALRREFEVVQFF